MGHLLNHYIIVHKKSSTCHSILLSIYLPSGVCGQLISVLCEFPHLYNQRKNNDLKLQSVIICIVTFNTFDSLINNLCSVLLWILLWYKTFFSLAIDALTYIFIPIFFFMHQSIHWTVSCWSKYQKDRSKHPL